MLGGTFGKILHVNLTNQTHRIEQPNDDFYRLLVGGRAVIAYLLLRDLEKNTDPFSPDNLLIFAPGILQGSNLPGSGRHAVGGKSPLTGALGSSEAGGWWGHEFKRTGFDALVIRGRSEKPVFLWLADDGVEIRPATHLWGLPTAEAQASILEELGDDNRIRVAQIGLAGENLVRYAAIMHNANRAAARNGLGALMGSKNLKAIAVRGTQNITKTNPERVKNIATWLGKNYKELAAWAATGRGTQDSLMNLAYTGGVPVQNFNLPLFDNPELLSGERNYEMFLKERDTCQVCPIRCKQVFEYKNEDPNQNLDPVYGGPEYEAMAVFGPNCGVEDNIAVAKANELCNAYGLDVLSAGAVIAFVMECADRDILSSEETNGIRFTWGNGEALLSGIEMIAHRDGFGNIMAEGVARISKQIGPVTDEFNLTIKGQELPMHDPRLNHGKGIGYAVAPVGADHMMNMHDIVFTSNTGALKRVNSALDRPIKPLSNTEISEEKLQILYRETNWRHFQDCALNCHFYPYDYSHLAEALSGITGIEYNLHDVLNVGARAQTLGRLFNLREGFTAADDLLPRRVMKAFKSGPLANIDIDPAKFNWAIKRFYELMRWDPNTGAPTQQCIEGLELAALLEDIHK